jgi:hypothetical protein
VPAVRASQRNLDNLTGANNGSFAALPAVARRATEFMGPRLVGQLNYLSS